MNGDFAYFACINFHELVSLAYFAGIHFHEFANFAYFAKIIFRHQIYHLILDHTNIVQ